MLRRNATLAERLGSFFLMSEALTPVALPGAWILLVALFFVDAHLPRALFPALALGTWVSAGNIAACFEAGAAARLARGSREILLMPLTFFGGAVNLTATVAATISPFPKPSSEHATVGETPPSAQRRTK
jgi:hypothetical protein